MEPSRLPARRDEPQIRISDAERDGVVSHLQLATAEGRLTIDEFQDRARLVYKAQYLTDLEPITADLPAPVVEIVARTRPHRRFLLAAMGGNDRTGSWDPGDQSIALTVMGGQTLDLTQVAATEVSIFAITVMGGTEIIVPDGAFVDMSGLMLMGATSNNTEVSGNSVMRVRIRAIGAMGACEVRNLSDKERRRNRKPLGQ